MDDDADLTKPCTAVVASAFGYAGQEVLGCSRVIVAERSLRYIFARLIDSPTR